MRRMIRTSESDTSRAMMCRFSRPERCKNDIGRMGTGSLLMGLGGYNVMLKAESINTNVPGGEL